MAGKCSRDGCYPEETGCNFESEDDVKKCSFYTDKTEISPTEDIQSEGISYKFPWTSNSFGMDDLKIVSARSRVCLIAIVGPSDAGKTTFLGCLFCLLRNGQKLNGYEFAGSYTIKGWENISYPLNFKSDHLINFPTHTSSNIGRVPGLLHLALKSKDGIVHDIIFPDAPGEWFEKWAINKNDPNAAGAEWLHQTADAFLIFADRKKLQGSEIGKTKLGIRQISDRIKNNVNKRPIGIVWAKSDLDIANEIKTGILNDVNRNLLVKAEDFEVSIKSGDNHIWHKNILAAIDWIMASINRKQSPIQIPVIKDNDFFLLKRG